MSQVPQPYAGRNSTRRCDDSLSTVERLRSLPYGAYLCDDDGEVVLFNRRYQPIYRRDATGRVSPDDPQRWVLGIRRKSFFYDDGCRPLRNLTIRRRVAAVLARWKAAAAGHGCADLDALVPQGWVVNVSLRDVMSEGRVTYESWIARYGTPRCVPLDKDVIAMVKAFAQEAVDRPDIAYRKPNPLLRPIEYVRGVTFDEVVALLLLAVSAWGHNGPVVSAFGKCGARSLSGVAPADREAFVLHLVALAMIR